MNFVFSKKQNIDHIFQVNFKNCVGISCLGNKKVSPMCTLTKAKYPHEIEKAK